MTRRLCLTLAALWLIPADPALARKWTDNTGKFTVEAELIAVAEGRVRLRTADGKAGTPTR